MFQPLLIIWKPVGIIIPNMWENKTCSKPQTTWWLSMFTSSILKQSATSAPRKTDLRYPVGKLPLRTVETQGKIIKRTDSAEMSDCQPLSFGENTRSNWNQKSETSNAPSAYGCINPGLSDCWPVGHQNTIMAILIYLFCTKPCDTLTRFVWKCGTAKLSWLIFIVSFHVPSIVANPNYQIANDVPSHASFNQDSIPVISSSYLPSNPII